jgi:L-lactate dehydrogenase complex protein LldG
VEGRREEGKTASTPGGGSQEGSVKAFIHELTLVAGRVTEVSSRDLTREVLALLQSRGIHSVHIEPGLMDDAQFSLLGIEVSHAPDASAQAGVTGALCGLADTGSVLVADGPGGPLQASLLPPIHIAVLRAVDILPSLADALRLPQVTAAAASVVITGPSRTGDIEMTHTIGVHGPGEVHVFVVEG